MAVAKRKAEVVPQPSKSDIGKEVLKLVELMHEEKKISRDIIFNGIEAAILLAAQRHFGVEEDDDDFPLAEGEVAPPANGGVHVHIDRATGEIIARFKDAEIDPVTLGRIAAQSAKQAMIQKIREAESDTVFNEYTAKKGEMVVGTVQRVDAGTAIVTLGKSEALLPRSEQIPGESHHVGERVKAVIFEVRRQGHRVKIVLSRAHPDFVRALFEEEIPEIDDRTIDIKAVAREAGYRSKLAVVSIDMKVDCVGACVGVRGSRIKNIIEELNGERIDIVRWNDSLQVLIPNALQPAQISDVFTYPRLGRAIVLVTEDQLSLAIGRRGQNVRLASKLVQMDLEIMTVEELGEALERAERWFGQLPNANPEAIQAMIEEGFLSYNELTFIDAKDLASFTGLSEEHADELLIYAEEYADVMEQGVAEERRAAEEAAAAAEAQARAEAEATAAAEAAATAAAAEGTEALAEGTDAVAAAGEEAGVVVEAPAGSYHEGPTGDAEAMEAAAEHAAEQEGTLGEADRPTADATEAAGEGPGS